MNTLRGYYTLCNKLLGNPFMKDTTKHINFLEGIKIVHVQGF